MRTITRLTCLFLLGSATVFAQPAAKSTGTSGIVRSVENIGKELLSLFGSDDETPVNTAAPTGTKPKRKKVTMALVYTPGKAVVNGDAKTCESGAGVCTFALYPADQAPSDGQKIMVSAMFMPRQRKLGLEFESMPDVLKNEQGKLLLVVRHSANDATSTDGAIILKNKKALVQNGDYEIVNNRVLLNIELPNSSN